MPQACNFTEKETLAKVFYSKFCRMSENIFFIEHPWMTATEVKWNEVFTITNWKFFIWKQYDIENWYHYNMKFYIGQQHHYVAGKRYHITISLQSQYVIGLYRNVNLTKIRYYHSIGCQLILLETKFGDDS